MEERKDMAFLSNSGSYSIFQFQDDVIRFMTSPRLEKYQKVLEWDAGYLVVIAKYKDLAEMEEYIDLVLFWKIFLMMSIPFYLILRR